MKLVLYSSDDLAGGNIARLLVEELKLASSAVVRVEGNIKDKMELPVNLELAIVASRHKSESGTPTLTCHATGNFGKAELGGSPGRLQSTNALYLRKALLLLKEKQRKYSLPYDVSLEVTHHGPTELPFPLVYVEVGSSELQWNDMSACRAVAEVIYELYSTEPEKVPVAIGFGGPHYAPNFSEVMGNVALGHIMPKHAVEYATLEMVKLMLEKTVPKPDFAVLDWKGLKSEEKQKITGILEGNGISWKKTSELKG
ncbi:MAG: D-aminoacyl-tRNA deacylase [Candidatus Altiarchaeota archaeon]|nr:D-aminoacyl-tRNA deacylase [Candidatus Altiarchaeota archaeon]